MRLRHRVSVLLGGCVAKNLARASNSNSVARETVRSLLATFFFRGSVAAAAATTTVVSRCSISSVVVGVAELHMRDWTSESNLSLTSLDVASEEKSYRGVRCVARILHLKSSSSRA